jgi:hypothetical protein
MVDNRVVTYSIGTFKEVQERLLVIIVHWSSKTRLISHPRPSLRSLRLWNTLLKNIGINMFAELVHDQMLGDCNLFLGTYGIWILWWLRLGSYFWSRSMDSRVVSNLLSASHKWVFDVPFLLLRDSASNSSRVDLTNNIRIKDLSYLFEIILFDLFNQGWLVVQTQPRNLTLLSTLNQTWAEDSWSRVLYRRHSIVQRGMSIWKALNVFILFLFLLDTKDLVHVSLIEACTFINIYIRQLILRLGNRSVTSLRGSLVKLCLHPCHQSIFLVYSTSLRVSSHFIRLTIPSGSLIGVGNVDEFTFLLGSLSRKLKVLRGNMTFWHIGLSRYLWLLFVSHP